MPTTSISGVASGIDWQQTVELLMQIASQPMVNLETRKETYEGKLSAWQTINVKLLALNTAMEAMDELNEVLTKEGTSSNGDVVTVSATSSAITGSYSIIVNQLAQCDKETHAGWADSNTTEVTAAGGTFSYNYAGSTTPYEVEISAGATLTDLAQAINNDVNNPGISATILNDGSQSATAYHLVLSGETGELNTITDITGPPGFTGSWENTQQAINAEIRVDGYPSTGWIESDSNDVDDVIEGVILHLISTSATAVNATISNDTDAAQTLIEEFVSAYNDVLASVNQYTAYDAETEEAGVLFGDSSAISVKGDLQSVISSTIPGLTENAVYQSLSEIGIKSGTGGYLSITDSKLEDALAENFDAVGDVFAFSTTSTSNNLIYFARTDDTQGGVYTVAADFDASGNLLDTTTINGHPVQIDGDYIIGMEGYPEEGLRIKFTDPGGGAGSLTADVYVGTGAAVQLSNRVSYLTDPIDGTVQNAEQSIEDSIENLNEQIADWEVRLEATEAKLTQQFMMMETLISQLQGQGNFVSAMIANF